MSTKVKIGVSVAVIIGVLALLAFAYRDRLDSDDDESPRAAKSAAGSQLPSSTLKISGCLQKGPGGNEFLITDKTGHKYEVQSSSVALGDHVGHSVTITGTVASEAENEQEEREEREKDEAAEQGSSALQARELTMDSATCQ
jgi:hypothetical protein